MVKVINGEGLIHSIPEELKESFLEDGWKEYKEQAEKPAPVKKRRTKTDK